jgi:hypothetical protein
VAFAFISADPLACQPSNVQPVLPTFHITSNVTKNTDGSTKLGSINDCSGITYYGGLYTTVGTSAARTISTTWSPRIL